MLTEPISWWAYFYSLSGRNHGCLPILNQADQMASPTQAVSDNTDTTCRPVVVRSNAQSARLLPMARNFQTDQQEPRWWLSLIGRSICATPPGGEAVEPPSANEFQN